MQFSEPLVKNRVAPIRVSYLLGSTDALLSTVVQQHEADNQKKTSQTEIAVELFERHN